VGHRITEAKPDSLDDGVAERIRFAERAFAYDFVEDENRSGVIAPGPRLSSSEREWPQALDVVPDQELETWALLAERVTSDLAKVHLGDLALVTGKLSGRERASALAETYFSLAKSEALEAYYRGSCARRAWSLARQFRLEIEAEVRVHLHTVSCELARIADALPGVLFRYVEPLGVAPRVGDFVNPSQAEVHDLLSEIERLHPDSLTMIEAVCDVRVMLAHSPEERAEARESVAIAYLRRAAPEEGFAKQSWLSTAADYAKRHGLIVQRDEAVRGMQDLRGTDLGLQSYQWDKAVPISVMNQEVARLRQAHDLCSALDVWLAGPAPTGSYEANLEHAKALSQGSIVSLVTRVSLDPDGMPIRTTTGLDSAISERLEINERLIAGFSGLVLANALDAMAQEFEVVDSKTLALHLQLTFGCDLEKAFALAEGFLSYWAGRSADAGRIAFPLVEAGARGVLLHLGESLFRVEAGNSPGRFPSLETYIGKLESNGFDPDWIRTLRNPIATLRNALAHGHRTVVSKSEAALLLRVAALLIVLTPPDSSTIDRNEVEARLRDPVGYVAAEALLHQVTRSVWVPKP